MSVTDYGLHDSIRFIALNSKLHKNFKFCRSSLTTWAEVALLVTLAASAAHALLSRLLSFYQGDIVLSEAQMRLMHIDPKNHPGFKGGLVLTAEDGDGMIGTRCLG